MCFTPFESDAIKTSVCVCLWASYRSLLLCTHAMIKRVFVGMDALTARCARKPVQQLYKSCLFATRGGINIMRESRHPSSGGAKFRAGAKRCLVLTAAVSGLKRLKRAASPRAARRDADFSRRALEQTGGSASLQSQNTTAKSALEGRVCYIILWTRLPSNRPARRTKRWLRLQVKFFFRIFR